MHKQTMMETVTLVVTNENVIDLVSFNCTVRMWKMPSTCIIALIIADPRVEKLALLRECGAKINL